MIRLIFLLLGSLLTVSCVSTHTSGVRTYLSIDLPYAGFEKIRKDVEQKQNLVLKNRGEAHITVISPPEYKRLQSKISMKEIEQIAQEQKLEEVPYKAICVGEASLKNSANNEKTFYVVIKADRLFEFREKILQLYVSRGGNPGDFAPGTFYPHITLGFTQRDLHLEDGVIKDTSSCLYPL